MGVVKSKRTTSRLEVQHHFYKVRRDVTALVLRDFGYSPEKYARSIEQYRKAHANAPNIDEIVARWERKAQSFHQRRRAGSPDFLSRGGMPDLVAYFPF